MIRKKNASRKKLCLIWAINTRAEPPVLQAIGKNNNIIIILGAKKNNNMSLLKREGEKVEKKIERYICFCIHL